MAESVDDVIDWLEAYRGYGVGIGDDGLTLVIGTMGSHYEIGGVSEDDPEPAKPKDPQLRQNIRNYMYAMSLEEMERELRQRQQEPKQAEALPYIREMIDEKRNE